MGKSLKIEIFITILYTKDFYNLINNVLKCMAIMVVGGRQGCKDSVVRF